MIDDWEDTDEAIVAWDCDDECWEFVEAEYPE